MPKNPPYLHLPAGAGMVPQNVQNITNKNRIKAKNLISARKP